LREDAQPKREISSRHSGCNYNSRSTPILRRESEVIAMIAEFSIYPLDGSQWIQVKERVVEVLHDSKLSYQVGPIGICVEGDWDEVMTAIRQCHDALIPQHERLITTITIDDVKTPVHRLVDLVKHAEIQKSRMPHGDMEVEC
jgi:uncharacterized protein YqgV (UPF0045/DUF77 family)